MRSSAICARGKPGWGHAASGRPSAMEMLGVGVPALRAALREARAQIRALSPGELLELAEA